MNVKSTEVVKLSEIRYQLITRQRETGRPTDLGQLTGQNRILVYNIINMLRLCGPAGNWGYPRNGCREAPWGDHITRFII